MAQDQNTGELKRISFFVVKNKMFLIVLTALILIGILWLWKDSQIKHIKDNSHDQYSNRQLEELKLLTRPYVWAVRREMLNKNYQQIELYAAEMIRYKGFESIMVSDADDVVISATNKKFEGQNIRLLVDTTFTAPDSTTVNRVNDSLAIVSSPIMGFNSRLGTLILNRKIYRIKY
ncbi:hypothetical protein [Pedobacter nyackensis]|uniref:hypothetical protein n=1 Tax=Pedobacter nyackensis TaxID=475255 RepID=UPI002930186A|nr:hypothetical protein [Pedobacter nyackensis]